MRQETTARAWPGVRIRETACAWAWPHVDVASARRCTLQLRCARIRLSPESVAPHLRARRATPSHSHCSAIGDRRARRESAARRERCRCVRSEDRSEEYVARQVSSASGIVRGVAVRRTMDAGTTIASAQPSSWPRRRPMRLTLFEGRRTDCLCALLQRSLSNARRSRLDAEDQAAAGFDRTDTSLDL